MISFFLVMEPPTVTAQEHKVMVRYGRPIIYDTQRIKDARALYEWQLKMHRPPEPILGPVELHVDWYFLSKTQKELAPKITKPDTDNLQKLLKDCMTRVGFWKDDAQVCIEHVSKSWTRRRPGLRIEVISLTEVM